eukprot:CAMPEP_0181537518 /NCGR_PEP_ID=MMETSP1110-20121109/75390_1 /TAXON_ID=174948 /ORGANISM="Symbiodinium sp., Strain CCMP421" /LENGTH=32 /DNA_ID= /DNA_START= /DNA_END= /DNA_ORIENTATION=
MEPAQVAQKKVPGQTLHAWAKAGRSWTWEFLA